VSKRVGISEAAQVVRVLVVEPSVFGLGFQLDLRRERAVQVVGVVRSHADALAQVASYLPDVVMLGLAPPGRAEMDLLDRLHAAWPDLPIVGVGASPTEPEFVLATRERGLAAYFPQRATHDEQLATILRVAQSPEPAADPHAPPRLSRRQLQILRGIAAAQTSREIGAALGLASHTVANQLSVLFETFGVTSRNQLFLEAVRLGLVEIRPNEPLTPSADVRSA
jgi:DNA-binding NarL/FixJ family response regulator